ncbi:hypothetical protein BH11ARM2_BH11ARM2_23920 [soil metagenome]
MTRRYPFFPVALGCLLLAGCHEAAPEATAAPAASPAKDAARTARRQVKTAQDADAGGIDPTVKATTIEEITAQKLPGGDLGKRVAPFETSVWKADATIKSIELKKDGDFYLVLNGDKGGQTVMEVPDPALCKDSRFKDQIAATRKALEEKYHPTSDPKELNDRATVTGVGFLGWGANGKGAKGKSGPRIMPGMGIEFK